MRKLIIFNLLCLIGMKLNAQSELSPKLKDYEYLLGEWEVQTIQPLKPDSGWSEPAKGSASIHTVLDGTFINEKVAYNLGDGSTLTMFNILGIDPRTGELRFIALDKEFGTMDIYKGTPEGSDISVSNIHSDTTFITDQGKALYFRLNFTQLEEGFELLVESTSNQGWTWQVFNKNIYTRKEE